MPTATERVLDRFPEWEFLLKDPEVGKLLRDAVDPNKGYSDNQFKARLYKTGWFRRRSLAARQMEILRHTDPAEYRRQIRISSDRVRQQAHSLGLRLSNAESAYMARGALASGIEIGSDEYNFNLYKWAYKQSPAKFATGAVKGQMNKVKALGRGEYYLNISDRDARRIGLGLALGQRDEAAVQEWMKQRAKSKYAHLSARLDAGETMESMFSGHRQTIAEELELDPETIDFAQSRWSRVLDHYDKNSKTHRPYTLQETRTLARQDERWWKTSGGKEAQAGMVNFLLNRFGERA